MTEDEGVGWHHWLNGHEFEQVLGDSEGQGRLVSCSPWGRKESDTTEWLNISNKAVAGISVSQDPHGVLMQGFGAQLLYLGGVVFQLLSRVRLCDSMDCSMPGFPILHHLPELVQTHVYWAHDAIQPSHPLSFPFPLVLNVSQNQDLFQWVSPLHQVAQVLSFSISLSNEYLGLISFRIDWVGLLAVQRTEDTTQH